MMLLLANVGCAQSTPALISDVRWAKNITLSCKDTPATRVQIIAHNSVLDTLKSGRRVVYKDDCPPVEKPTS
jgi:hypothetical protein